MANQYRYIESSADNDVLILTVTEPVLRDFELAHQLGSELKQAVVDEEEATVSSLPCLIQVFHWSTRSAPATRP